MQFEHLNLVAKNGEYKDKGGKVKDRWVKIGETVETRTGGIALRIDMLPVEFDGWINLAVPSKLDYES
jgi:hypothetical protein